MKTPNPEHEARKAASGKPAVVIPKGEMLVSADALCEIRVTIHHALETAINMCLECSSTFDSGDAAELIRPAVERLAAICEENGFPE